MATIVTPQTATMQPFLLFSSLPSPNAGSGASPSVAIVSSAYTANPYPVEATNFGSLAPPPPPGPHIASASEDEEDEKTRKKMKKDKAQRKRKRKPDNMAEFIHSLSWPTQNDRDEVTGLLVDKNGLELADILDVPDDLLLNELARAGVGKMGFRMKILNGRRQFLPKKRKPSEHPRTGPDGEPLSSVATSRTRKLAMHRLEIAHERYAAVKALLNSGKAASVHAALDQLDIKKSTFFDCKYVTELKIIDETKFNEIKAEMLDKRKTAKDFNTACYNYLKELKRKGVRIDDTKRGQLLPNSY